MAGVVLLLADGPNLLVVDGQAAMRDPGGDPLHGALALERARSGSRGSRVASAAVSSTSLAA
jgi:hypothetical protein